MTEKWHGAVVIKRKDHSKELIVPDLFIRLHIDTHGEEDLFSTRHDPDNIRNALRYQDISPQERDYRLWIIVKVYPKTRIDNR